MLIDDEFRDGFGDARKFFVPTSDGKAVVYEIGHGAQGEALDGVA